MMLPRCMTNSYQDTNNWFVMLIDEEKDQKIKELTEKIDLLKFEIDERAGDLIKERNGLVKERKKKRGIKWTKIKS